MPADHTWADVEAAAGFGVDLIAGQHDRLVAESCRRLGFDPMTICQWSPAELHAVGAMNHELVTEMERGLRQQAAVLDAMRVRGCSMVGDLPVRVIALALDCAPEVAHERLAAVISPWWGGESDG